MTCYRPIRNVPGVRPTRRSAQKPGRQPEYSTFRPNPVGKVPAGGKAGVRPKGPSRSGGRTDPDVVSFEKPEEGPRWYERILFGRVSWGSSPSSPGSLPTTSTRGLTSPGR